MVQHKTYLKKNKTLISHDRPPKVILALFPVIFNYKVVKNAGYDDKGSQIDKNLILLNQFVAFVYNEAESVNNEKKLKWAISLNFSKRTVHSVNIESFLFSKIYLCTLAVCHLYYQCRYSLYTHSYT